MTKLLTVALPMVPIKTGQISPAHPGGKNSLWLSPDFALHQGFKLSLLFASEKLKNAQKLQGGGMRYKQSKKPQTKFN